MEHEVKLTVYGTVRGKQRHVVTRTGHRYTPKQTVDYEYSVGNIYKEQYHGVQFEKDVPIGIEINAFIAVPKTGSKRILQDKRDNKIRPTRKPDADNIAKIIKDALNGLAYHDDAQVVEEHVYKWFGEERVEVRLYQICEVQQCNAGSVEKTD